MKYVTHRFWCFAVILTTKAFLLNATLVKYYKIENMLRNMNIQFSIVITLLKYAVSLNLNVHAISMIKHNVWRTLLACTHQITVVPVNHFGG